MRKSQFHSFLSFLALLLFGIPPFAATPTPQLPASAIRANITAFTAAAANAAEAPAPAPKGQSIARLADQANRMIPRQEYGEALEVIHRGLRIDPTYIPLWRLKALAHIALGQNAEAEEALRVCLLRDPGDIEANVLLLKNAMEWTGANLPERIRRVSGQLREMPPGLFADALFAFMRRKDFPEYLTFFLKAWNSSGGHLGQIRQVLDAYAGNHLEQADSFLGEINPKDVPGLKPAHLGGLHRLLAEALDPNATNGWSVDKGELTRDHDRYVVAAKPGSDAFAWLRLSEGWKDVAVSIDFPGETTGSRSLYLRHRPPQSFIRVTHNGEAVLVQERVQGLGLFTLSELSLEEIAGRPLRLILKGERLGVYADDAPLIALPLPVSSSITDGRVALAYENPGAEPENAVFSSFSAVRIDPSWLSLTGAEANPAAEIRANRDATGVLVILGSPPDAGQKLPTALLNAANAGLSVYGLLPEGSLDLNALQKPLTQLPALLADRMWNGVVVRPQAETSLTAVAELCQTLKGKNLQTGLYLTDALAPSLAAYPGGLYFDWLIVGEGQKQAAASLERRERFYGNILFEGEGRFRVYR